MRKGSNPFEDTNITPILVKSEYMKLYEHLA